MYKQAHYLNVKTITIDSNSGGLIELTSAICATYNDLHIHYEYCVFYMHGPIEIMCNVNLKKHTDLAKIACFNAVHLDYVFGTLTSSSSSAVRTHILILAKCMCFTSSSMYMLFGVSNVLWESHPVIPPKNMVDYRC